MFTVGQKLFYVPANRYRRTEPHEVTVVAVGRKWVSFKDGSITERFAITDKRMAADGGEHQSLGRCYLSKEDYGAERALSQRWLDLVKWVEQYKWGPPRCMTVERIEQAESLLKVCEEVAP